MIAGINLVGKFTFSRSFMENLHKRIDPSSRLEVPSILEAVEFGTDGTNRVVELVYQNADKAGFVRGTYRCNAYISPEGNLSKIMWSAKVE